MLNENLNRRERRAAKKYLEKRKATISTAWREIPSSEWAAKSDQENRIKVWQCRDFLAQVFEEKNGVLRISINRTTVNNFGDWKDGISWEELQNIKNQIGFAERDAVEIFPAESDEVNVANIRHLWVLPEKLSFGWRS